MTLDKIKSEIAKIIGKKVLVKVYIGRNKYEYIEGIISGTYPFLFTIQTENETKSFSYSDVLTKYVILKTD